MAPAPRMLSDITGAEANETEFGRLVIKLHPAIDPGAALGLGIPKRELRRLVAACIGMDG